MLYDASIVKLCLYENIYVADTQEALPLINTKQTYSVSSETHRFIDAT